MLPSVLASVALSEAATSQLQQQLQATLDSISNVTGYSFSVGYKDADTSFGLGSGPRNPEGRHPSVAGRVDGADAMLLGSGSKPYTAAAVMRLVERGVVRLEDPAAAHVDAILQRMNGTSLTVGCRDSGPS